MATTTVVEMQKHERQEGVRLEITRVIKAPRQRVFDAWSRPEMIRQWFGPGEKLIQGVDADPRAGGEYRFAMGGAAEGCPSGPEGIDMRRDSVVTGQYVKVVPHELLQFTWRGDWQPDEESLVTVELRDVEDGTEMRLIQEGFLTEVSCSRHGIGWNGSFDKLTRLLEAE
jgi:uncharacterized protein YndB with AHSA1/START domain